MLTSPSSKPGNPNPPANEEPSAILLVDDSEDDAELVRRALARGGVHCTLKRVDDAPSFRAALAEREWDLVIADYSQPTFGALVVLEELRAHDVDISCLVISGVAGEDRAVETMRAGAKDFVSKDRLQRLAPAVQRELGESAQRRERTRTMREEGERDERLYAASGAIFDLLRGGDFTSGNESAVYRSLAELVARTLDVDQVSIWMFEAGRSIFRCVESWDRATRLHTQGRTFPVERRREYFAALDEGRFVEAHDAESQGRGSAAPTADARVSSQLDAAIRFRGEMIGAICLDHRGAPRHWRSHEQVFVGSIADLISQVVEGRERRRTEVALHESETRYRELWAHARDGMFTLDPEGRITSVNAAAERLTGRSPNELLTRHFTDFLAARDVQPSLRVYAALVMNDPIPGPLSFTIARPDGTRVQAEASAERIVRNGRFVEVLGIVRDVSQRRMLEAQLQQSQKMEAIGRLAGGVAHDFNNMLTAIIGYAQIAALRADLPPAASTDLKEITAAAHRAAALTRQLLAFSRRQVLEPRVLNVNTVVSGIEVLLRRLIGEDVELITDLEADVAHVLADPSQLEQVVLNLVVNARDAMPSGGTIVLRTRTADALAPGTLTSPQGASPPFAVIEVQDTGIGMDEETRSHIFEPFFTTKALGTGLGLSTVYGIVQQSGGGLAVSSELGVGSTFTAYFPVVVGASDEYEVPTMAMGPPGTECVLVVEDDDRVRSLALRLLRLAGYTVLEASDPRSALTAVETNPSVDLVVCDVVLPHLNARELFRHLQAVRPRLRVLYMSGYREGNLSEQGEHFLAKPFTAETLTTAVRRVLDKESASDGVMRAG